MCACSSRLYVVLCVFANLCAGLAQSAGGVPAPLSPPPTMRTMRERVAIGGYAFATLFVVLALLLNLVTARGDFVNPTRKI